MSEVGNGFELALNIYIISNLIGDLAISRSRLDNFGSAERDIGFNVVVFW